MNDVIAMGLFIFMRIIFLIFPHMRFQMIHFGHTRSYRKCKMRFLSRKLLEEHNIRHNMVVSHNCDVCNSVFYNSSALMRHVKFHNVSPRRTCYMIPTIFHVLSKLMIIDTSKKDIIQWWIRLRIDSYSVWYLQRVWYCLKHFQTLFSHGPTSKHKHILNIVLHWCC
jgi:hypothetical protein